jgi:hypothetical protein
MGPWCIWWLHSPALGAMRLDSKEEIMPTYTRSRLTLAGLVTVLGGCGAGSGDSVIGDGGGGLDSASTSSGSDGSAGLGPDASSISSFDSGSTLPGPDASSTSGSDSGSTVGSDASETMTSDSGSDAGSTSHTDSGSDAKSDVAASTEAGRSAECSFASGLNVAWVNFANDVPNPDIATFSTIFANAYAAGGRVVRWWFHTNGTVTPGYQSNGMVQNLPQSHIDGVKSILAAANAAHVALNISLWSFDMLQANAGATHTQNLALLQDTNIRNSYINNYLTPLVTALKGTPGLYSYEIFNEPEGMTATGWATYRTTEAYVQTCVNQFAAAIHAADPTVLVTNGSQTFDYCSNAKGKTNYYSDAALRAAGGMQNGTLDFYEVHYYTSNGTSDSCFKNPASYWGLDKKLVMGEFFAATTDGVTQDDTYTYLYDNGYNGAWAWSYESDMAWPSMQVPMQDLYSAQKSTVGSCR